MATTGPAKELDPEETKKQQGGWRLFFSFSNLNLWLLVMMVAAVIALGWFCGNAIFSVFTEAKEWFLDELPYSLVVYYVVFCLCAMVLIPYGPFCIAIGYIFGLGWGLLIQMLAVFMSACLLFGIGRYLFKEKVDEISNSKGSRVWKGLMKYMGKDWKEAAKINVLLCFMPVPVRFVIFFMLGMMPNTVLNLLIGEALSQAAEPQGVSTYHFIGTALAITGVIAAVWYASSIATQVLDEADQDEPTEEDKLLS